MPNVECLDTTPFPFRNGPFAGKSIAQVAQGLQSGAIKPSQLPIKVIYRDGKWYTMNNRSLLALQNAGMKPDKVIDVTGDKAAEKALSERLQENPEIARDDYVPQIRDEGGHGGTQ